MRSLHVDTGREMGGGQWQVVYLLERISDATLLAPAKSSLFAEAAKRGIHVEPLSFARLVQLARRADLIHAHDARAHTLSIIAGGAYVNRPRVVVARRVGFPVQTSLPSQWKYERATGYLAVSRFVAGRLADAGVPETKIRVVYDGVPLPQLAEPVAGRIVALSKKGGEVLQTVAERSKIPIHFTSNLWQDLSTASVFVYVSEMEGLGSAVLAAMSAGVPVVATGVGGLPEIVEHRRTGLLVDAPATPEKIAGAVGTLLADAARAREMGRRGRERVEREFTVEMMVQRTLDAYTEGFK